MNTKSKRGEAGIELFVVFMFFVLFIGGCCTGATVTERSYRTEAVKLGYATGVVDEAGNTTFQWKETK